MNKQLQKKLISCVCALAMILCMIPIMPLQVAAEERTIKVGVYELQRFHDFDENGEVEGYDVEYLNKIAETTGWKYEYVKANSWSEAIQMLRDGRIDLLSPSQITTDRMQEFGYSAFPIGKVYAAILTQKDNSDIVYEDYEQFGKMTFGIEKGNTYQGIFESYAKENGFTPNIQFYPNHDALVAALRTGEVDAIIANIMRAEDDMRLIGRAGTALYYYMFRKGDTSLENQLNNALDLIEISNPNFQEQLVSKYFPIYEENPFTKAEMDYIKSLPTIKIACKENAKPLSYVNETTGEMEGIYIDYLKKVAECSGIQFEFVPMSGTGDELHAKEQNIQLAVYPVTQMTKEEKEQMLISDTFWNAQEVIVCNKNYEFSRSNHLKMAYYGLQDYGQVLEEKYPGFQLIQKDTIQECLESVRSGEADCLLGNQYHVDYALQKPENENLVTVPDAGLEESFAIMTIRPTDTGKSLDTDVRLMSIFNKAFEQINQQEVEQIVIKYTTAKPYQLTNQEVLYKFRIQFILIILLILFAVGGSAIVFAIRDRSRKQIELTNRKLEEANEGLENTNAQLAVAVEKANAANVAKSQFLAQMSHEIRTPMNAIIGLTNIASKDLSDPTKTYESLRKIDGASKLLLGIINDVLDMSAIESKKMKLANMEFDFKELLTSVTTVFYQQCKQKNIDFEMQLKGVTEEVLIGDSLRVNQILMNLLSNAVKFTSAGGQINVLVIQASSSKNTAHMRFIVSDTGCGMSEDLKERLFNPFEQEDATTARKHGGSGLGLAITRNLVEMMNGMISVESEKGKGTAFTVDIPFGMVKTQMPMQENAFSDIRTLIVDDDDDACQYAGLILDRLGVPHEYVTSGEAALEAMGEAEDQENPFHLCLVDWKMPQMDGVEVTRKIREIFGKDTIVIIASAYDQEEVEMDGYDAGADYFIPKPMFQSSVYNILMKISKHSERLIPEVDNQMNDQTFSGKKALIAEDVSLNMEVAVELLKMVGVSCVCAEDGAIAVDIFKRSKEHEFDVIFLDINMPNMDGYEAARQLRALDREDIKNMPIYAMTANAFSEDIAASLEAGMNGHISKPIEPKVLYKTLETAFEEHVE